MSWFATGVLTTHSAVTCAGPASPVRGAPGGSLQHVATGQPPLSPSKLSPSKTSPTKASPRTGSPTKGSPNRRHSIGGQMERRQSLSTLAPVIEEPSVLPASMADSLTAGNSGAAAAAAAAPVKAESAAAPPKLPSGTGGMRMTSSLDWLQSQSGRC